MRRAVNAKVAGSSPARTAPQKPLNNAEGRQSGHESDTFCGARFETWWVNSPCW